DGIRDFHVTGVQTCALPISDDPEIRAMFADEIRLCATLDHPGIVHTYDVGEWEGLPFLVLEFVDGASLDRLAAEGARLTPAEARSEERRVGTAGRLRVERTW